MTLRGPQLELPPHDEDVGESPRAPTPAHWLQLILGMAGRRVLLATAVFIASMAAVTGYFVTRRPIYRIETKILAQRPQALPSAVRPIFEDAPTRSAWELIHRRENLIALIRAADLLPQDASALPTQPRNPLARLSPGHPAAAADDPLDALAAVLDKRLLVMANDGTIVIQLDWPDPRQGFDIVEAALQNFLEARHLLEVKAIDDVISVQQGRASVLRKELDDAIADARRRPLPTMRAPPRARGPSEELVRLQSVIESKQRAIQDLEEFRRRRLADLSGQLDQARNTFSDVHPTVISLRQQIAALDRESPQIAALREEERKSRKEYNERAAREGVSAGTTLPVAAPPHIEPPASLEEDERVREARLQYEQISARLGAAQMERDAARAAFKFRYNVVWPPQLPSEPFSPNPVKIFGAGLLASLMLALGAAAAPDLLRGRLVQRWQVERVLDLPVLGDVRRK